MKKILLFLTLLCGLLTEISAQTIIPYLQAPTPSSIWITWKTASGNETSVDFGTSATQLNTNLTGTVKVMNDNGYNNNYYYHSAQLINLQPDTKYYYKVKTGTAVSEVYSFKTLPAPGQAKSDGHLRFVIIGDNQLKEPRWDSLVVAAKRKCEEKYGKPVNDHINLVVNVGDQVDVGTLDHYENVHMNKAKYLSALLPFNTLVGNHETYGSLNMQAYYDHFFYDTYNYKGLNPGTENYYAFQAGRVLFLMLSSEHTGATQLNWAKKVIDSAKVDKNVDWIITECHRPLQAEQYVGDISTWFRDNIAPKLQETEKSVLIIGAHHHLYARGQMKNNPTYHIISGGSAWDQYWGMSVEQDFDDVQKTLPNWGYQIIDFDVAKKTMSVECYSIGSKYQWKNNKLIDSFHRTLGQAKPTKPSLLNTFAGDQELPITLSSSAYATTTTELYNSTQFQVSQNAQFTNPELDKLRDFENFYGSAGRPDSTTDQNKGVDIFKCLLGANSLPNGTHYARVRHRDRNLEWSDWSDAVSFKIINSVVAIPTITTTKTVFAINESIVTAYSGGPGNAKDWIGIYKKGQTPGQGGVTSTTWDYVKGTSGNLTLKLATAGEYYIAFFTNDGYTEIAPRIAIYVGPTPVLTSDKLAYDEADKISITYATGQGAAKDWIGIYKVGNAPGTAGITSAAYKYVTGTDGTLVFDALPKGYYFASYFVNDGFFESSKRIYFSVGDRIATINTDKSVYRVAEDINVTFKDGPGIAKDYLGIFDKDGIPAQDTLVRYTYVGGASKGSASFTGENLPKSGQYFVVFFTNDSYSEISNRVYFEIEKDITTDIKDETDISDNISVYPNPVKDHAYIYSKYPVERVDLYDTQGKLIMTLDKPAQNEIMFLSNNLQAGQYILKVQSNKLQTIKMIIE